MPLCLCISVIADPLIFNCLGKCSKYGDVE